MEKWLQSNCCPASATSRHTSAVVLAKEASPGFQQ